MHAALPPALALHGAGGGAWEWAHWARAWRARHACFLAADFSREAAQPQACWTTLLHGLLTRHPADPDQVLIGASFGGLIACALADALEARALVLLNPLLPALTAAPVSVSHAQGLRRWGLRASAESTARAIPELASTEALTGFRRWSDFSVGLLNEAGALAMPARPRCPVLIVSSQNDREISSASLEQLSVDWAATLVRTPGSHVSPLLGRAWLRTFEEVETWLSRLDGDRR